MIRVEAWQMSGARLRVEQRERIERSYRIGLSQGQIAFHHRYAQSDGES